jgi:hypothetical protein
MFLGCNSKVADCNKDNHKIADKMDEISLPYYTEKVDIYLFNDVKTRCANQTIENLDIKIDSQFMDKVHEIIFDYYKDAYHDYKMGWSISTEEADHEKYLPRPDKIQTIKPYLSLPTIIIPREENCEEGTFGIEFECTWDVEHGCGIKIENWNPVFAGFAEVAYCEY